jgi:hypothetical protein
LQQQRDAAIEAVMSEATRLRELLESYRDAPRPTIWCSRPAMCSLFLLAK